MSWIIFIIMLFLFLESENHAAADEKKAEHNEMIQLRIMSYNIHHGEGEDGIQDLERISDIVRKSNIDIIGIQEVEKHWSQRTFFEDQAKMIANRLGMYYTYAANLDKKPLREGEPRRQYGTAILSKYPIVASNHHLLTKSGKNEQRGLLETIININGVYLNFYNVHLALTIAEREAQVREILDIVNQSNGPKIIVGDFNDTPDSNIIKRMKLIYHDVFAENNKPTFPAKEPQMRIDYIFISKELKVIESNVIRTFASDHVPISAVIGMNP